MEMLNLSGELLVLAKHILCLFNNGLIGEVKAGGETCF